MRGRIILIGASLLTGLASCGGSSTEPSDTAGSSTATSEAPTTEADMTAESSGSAETADNTSTTTTTLPPQTTTTTLAPPEPIPIEATLAQLSDDERVGRLLVADPEPSLADGTAIPPLPDAPCGFLLDRVDDAVVESMACEFETDDAAEAYLATWTKAIAEPSPVLYGTAATTTPITDLADWEGRVVSVPDRGELQPAAARADLVQQVGSRVFIASARTVTADPTVVVGPVVELATAQQELNDSNNIIDTPGVGRDDEVNRLSVQNLAPTWGELTSLGTQVAGTPSDSYYGLSYSEANPSEEYHREIEGVYSDEWTSYSVTSSIEMHPTISAARLDFYETIKYRCGPTVTPIPESVNAFVCLDNEYRQVALAQDGRITIKLETPLEIEADPAALQQIVVSWEQRLQTLGFPMGPGEVEPVTAPARSDAALPTDYFDPALQDGAYRLSSTYTTIVGDQFTTAGAVYVGPSSPGSANELRISVAPSADQLRDKYRQAVDPETLGPVTADAWAASTTVSYEDGDFRSYDGLMARLLPSGAVLLLQGDVLMVGGQQLGPNDAFIDPNAPVVTATWDKFQDFAYDDFSVNQQEATARELAVKLIRIENLAVSFDEQLLQVAGRVAPDSPPGTVAEWRTEWKQRSAPAATQHVVNFDSAESAAAYVQQLAGGATLTPYADVDGIAGGYDAGAGLVVASRGKWVVVYTSPGRTNWSSDYDGQVTIDTFATFVARYLQATGLE